MTGDSYSRDEASQLLGIAGRTLSELRQRGFVKIVDKPGRPRYPKSSIDEIAALLALYPTARSVDYALFELYMLYQCYQETQRHRARRRVLMQVQRLVEARRIWKLSELSKAIDFRVERLHRWASLNQIPALRIGKSYYLTATYANYLLSLYLTWLTAAEAAERLNVQAKTVVARIRKGVIPATLCLDDKYRINPDELKAFAPEPDTYSAVSIVEAARLIGCGRSTFTRMVDRGNVRFVVFGGRRMIPQEEVARWKKRLATLNEPFTWLEPALAVSKVATLTYKQARRRLEVTGKTLYSWTTSGLLPYYWAAQSGEAHTRLYVARYISGFLRFAGGRERSKKLLEEYYALCSSTKNIV